MGTALSDTRSVDDERKYLKSKEAEKFEFEPWPQASKINSWTVSLRREVMSGSTHPRLTSEWSGEIDVAATMGELDHSGFMFDKHQMEFDTLDSKIAK